MCVSALVKMLQVLESDVRARGRPHGRVYVGAVGAFIGERDAKGNHLLLAPGELRRVVRRGAAERTKGRRERGYATPTYCPIEVKTFQFKVTPRFVYCVPLLEKAHRVG